jgi:hypothetical protein
MFNITAMTTQYPAQAIPTSDWRPGVQPWEYLQVLDAMWSIVARQPTQYDKAKYVSLTQHLLALLQPGSRSHIIYTAILHRTIMSMNDSRSFMDMVWSMFSCI